MGTYSQPSQILDTSFQSFREANQAAYDKEQAKRMAGIKARQKMAEKVLKERQKKLNEQEKLQGTIAEAVYDANAAVSGYQDLRSNMGVRIMHRDGQTEVTQLTAENWDKKSKLIENYSVYSQPSIGAAGGRELVPGFTVDVNGNYAYVGDDLTTDEVETDYNIQFSKDEIDWLENSLIRERTQAKLTKQYDPNDQGSAAYGTSELEEDQDSDLNLVDWYNNYKHKFNNTPLLGLGIDGSMQLQIEAAGYQMGIYKKSSQKYQEARGLLIKTKDEVPEFIGMLNNLETVQNEITDSNGLLKLTNSDKSLRYDIGNTPEAQEQFELQTNFVLDWGQENTAHRFSMELSPNGPVMVYYNPHISDKEFRVTKSDVENWTKKKGNMGLYQLSQENLDIVEKNIDDLMPTQKPTLTKTSNKYTRVNSKNETVEVSTTEAAYDFTMVNDMNELELQRFIYDRNRMVDGGFGEGRYDGGSFNGQNSWQLIGGPNYKDGALGLDWVDISQCGNQACKERARAQQDFVVDYYMNRYRKNNFSTMTSKDFKNLGDEGAKDIANTYINGESTVTFNDKNLGQFGFKRKVNVQGDSDYTLAEIASKFDNLKVTNNKGVNGVAQLLTDMSQAHNPMSAARYLSAEQVHALYKDTEDFDKSNYPAAVNGALQIYQVTGSGTLNPIIINNQRDLLNMVGKTYGFSPKIRNNILNSNLVNTPMSSDDLVMNMNNESLYDMLINGNTPTLNVG